jgi:hypothetical protein
MKNIAQKLSTENWEAGPELRVVRQNEAASGLKTPIATITSLLRSRRLSRPELAALNWEHRSQRLVKRSVLGNN